MDVRKSTMRIISKHIHALFWHFEICKWVTRTTFVFAAKEFDYVAIPRSDVSYLSAAQNQNRTMRTNGQMSNISIGKSLRFGKGEKFGELSLRKCKELWRFGNSRGSRFSALEVVGCGFCRLWMEQFVLIKFVLMFRINFKFGRRCVKFTSSLVTLN